MFQFLLRLILILGGAITLLITGITALPRRGVEIPPSLWLMYTNDPQFLRYELYRIRFDDPQPQWVYNLPVPSDMWSMLWSPDGRWIALNNVGLRETSGAIFRIQPDGNQFKLLSSGTSILAGWSNDSQWILYTQDHALYRMHPDGSNRQMLFHDIPVSRPIWSPDNRWIVFGSGSALYRIRADGSDLRRIAEGTITYTSGAWSPNSHQLVISRRDETGWRPYLVQADGSDLTLLTSMEASDPTWSPDGEWITFLSNADGEADVYRIRPNGSQVQHINSLAGDEYWPSWLPVWTNWSPDAQSIYFMSNQYNGSMYNSRLYRMNADGSDLHPLPYANAFASSPPVNIPYRPAIPILIGGIMLIVGLIPWKRAFHRLRF